MALDFDSLVIDRVVNITAENTAGDLLYLLNNLSNVNINVTSETKDKTDAVGVLIKRFFTAKSVEVSAEANLLSFNLMATQFGTEKQVASEGNKIVAPRFLFINTKGITEYTLPDEPLTEPTAIYAVNANGTLGKKYTSGVDASENEFKYDTESHKITLPTGVTGKVFIKYDYETDSGVKVVNRSDTFPKTVQLTMSVLVADTCSVDVVRHMYIVFPSFQVSPDCELTLDTESTQSFSGVAQADYCSDDKELYYFVLSEDDIEEMAA